MKTTAWTRTTATTDEASLAVDRMQNKQTCEPDGNLWFKSGIVSRVCLSDGRVVVIQRIKRTYSCYIVQRHYIDAPEYLARDATLDHCRACMLGELKLDVLDIV